MQIQLKLIDIINRQALKYINAKTLFCPICNNKISFISDYLWDNFVADQKDWVTYWIAGLVTHYRHDHIRYYDRSWRSPGYRRKNKEYTSYEDFKKIINNRAKRQILRAFIKLLGFPKNLKYALLHATKKLQYNDIDTENLIQKYLVSI
jgi:hypothetical protein